MSDRKEEKARVVRIGGGAANMTDWYDTVIAFKPDPVERLEHLRKMFSEARVSARENNGTMLEGAEEMMTRLLAWAEEDVRQAAGENEA